MKKLDKIFKEGLKKKEIAYEPHFWDDLESRLPSESSNKSFYWKIVVPIFLLGGLITVYQFSGFEKIEELTKSPKAGSEPQVTVLSNEAQKINPQADELLNQTSDLPKNLLKTAIKGDNQTENGVLEKLDVPPFIQDGNIKKASDGRQEKINAVTKREGGSNTKLELPEVTNLNPIRILSLFGHSSGYKNNLYLPPTPLSHKSWSLKVTPFVGYTNHAKSSINKMSATISESRETINSSMFSGVQIIGEQSNWRFGTGLELRSINQKVSYDHEELHEEVDISMTIIDRNFQTTSGGRNVPLIKTERDTMYHLQTVQLCVDCESTLSYLVLPASVGYTFNGRRVKPFLDIAVQTWIPYGAQGKYALKTENDFHVSQLNLKDLNVNFNLAPTIGVNYRVSSSIDLVAAYRQQIGFKSLFTTHNELLRSDDILIGVQFSLGGRSVESLFQDKR